NPLGLNLGDRPAALQHYRQALEFLGDYRKKAPDDAESKFLAMTQMEMGTVIRDSDPERAAEYFREALPGLKGGTAAHCHALLGSALQVLGKNDAAFQEFRRALGMSTAGSPEEDETLSVFVHEEYGDALLAAGDRPAALDSYQKALALAQKNVAAKPYN